MDAALLVPDKAFAALELDARLLAALGAQRLAHPSLVQATAIPLALAGRDVLARAKTGSGKTLAFALPVLHSVLARLDAEPESEATLALVLAPTGELVRQLCGVLRGLLSHAGGAVRIAGVSRDVPREALAAALRRAPHVLVGTPGRVAQLAKAREVQLANVATLALDEADLLLAYGFGADLRELARRLPATYHALLVSATLDRGVKQLGSLLLHDPAVVQLEDASATPGEAGAGGGKLREFAARCKSVDDKYLITYALLKLQVLAGKTLIFVNSIDKCYRVKLLLERFGLNAAVLNADLPINSRESVVQRFNRDLFDFLIATDEAIAHFAHDDDGKVEPKDESDDSDEQQTAADVDSDDDSEDYGDDDDGDDDDDDDDNEPVVVEDESSASDVGAAVKSESESSDADAAAQRKKKARTDDEFSAARGVDFVGVANVINFDVPDNVRSYMHRIGRTARGGADGVALTLVSTELRRDVAAAAQIESARAVRGGELKPFEFKMVTIEGLRSRVADVLAGVGRRAVRDARAASLRNELINSERLKAHFEDNPRELHLLRHNRPAQKSQVRAHLTFIPKYLLPAETPAAAVNKNAVRERKPVMTGTERRLERMARKRYKRLHSGSLRGYKSKILARDDQPFDDADNEQGEKRGKRTNTGSMFSKKEVRRIKRKAAR